jgi:hypothetical protein
LIVVLGAALIGWVAGETIAGDTALQGLVAAHPSLHYVAAALGAILVVGGGKLWRLRASRAAA